MLSSHSPRCYFHSDVIFTQPYLHSNAIFTQPYMLFSQRCYLHTALCYLHSNVIFTQPYYVAVASFRDRGQWQGKIQVRRSRVTSAVYGYESREFGICYFHSDVIFTQP